MRVNLVDKSCNIERLVEINGGATFYCTESLFDSILEAKADDEK